MTIQDQLGGEAAGPGNLDSESHGGPGTRLWASPMQAPPPKRRSQNVARILVGAAVSFLGLVLLYGLNQATMMVGLAVVCTAGIGLIPILFVSWLVGWVVLAAVEAIRAPRSAAPAS
jgi:hypothetical protein